MATHFNSKLPRFNPAVLPVEYMPRIADVVDEQHSKHYLIPGRIFASATPVAITTIAGSGVTLCLCDKQNRIGGANHFLTPVEAQASSEGLLQKMLALGANVRNLEGSIYGGSQPSVTFGNHRDWLGNRNVEAAMHFLGIHQIKLIEKEVGGTRGRKLVFQTDNGRAWSQSL